MSSAVFMANYEALDRCICDQVITDAVASRVGTVSTLLIYDLLVIYLPYLWSSNWISMVKKEVGDKIA